MSDPPTVHVERRPPVVVITIDRPERRNAVDRATADALEAAFVAFDADDELAVAVLTGAGGTFCAGADLKAVSEGRGNRVTPDGPGPLGPTRLLLDKPVIAAVEGHAVAGGLELALWCDLRVAAASTSFAIPEVDLGIPLAWGGLPRLVREIGAPATRDLVMTCRTFDADEAARLGLVQRVVDDDGLDAAVDELVATLVDKPPLPLRLTKRGVDAVTEQMVGRSRTWSDVDVLATALADPGFGPAAERYLARLADRRR